MSTVHEVERLATVYRQYHESDATQHKWSGANPGNRAITAERAHVLHWMLRSTGFVPLAGRRMLDIGCGSGHVLAGFMDWGALPSSLFGIELLRERIAPAHQLVPPLQIQCANAEHLHFQDTTFDLVLLWTVISSILDQHMARNIAQEVQRVLKPGGAVIWYDFRYNNPRNPHVRGVSRRDLAALFPGWTTHLRTLTLLPPLARRLGRVTPLLYPLLASVPLLRTHYLGILVKP